MKRIALAALAGPLAAAFAQAQAWLLWGPVYSRFPEPGYEYAMAHGMVPRNGVATPTAMLVSFLILAAAAFGVLRKPGLDRLLRALAFLVTGTASLVVLVYTVPEFRESNFFPLWIPVLLVGVALSIGVGWLAAAVADRRRRNSKTGPTG